MPQGPRSARRSGVLRRLRALEGGVDPDVYKGVLDITGLHDELTAVLTELPPEHVMVDGAELGSDDMTPEEAAKMLNRLSELAREARGAWGFVCLMTEW